MKLNIGSGQRPFGTPDHPWINIDVNPAWNPDVVASGDSLPYPDETVDMIVLHHVLEHFGCGEGDSMLRECFRVLKPGGSLLVFVPDMYELVTGWINGRIDTQIFLTNVYGAYMNHEADRHRWGFTGRTLDRTLKQTGAWSGVKAFDWRAVPGADLARDWWVLAMEAVK